MKIPPIAPEKRPSANLEFIRACLFVLFNGPFLWEQVLRGERRRGHFKL
jgi:hypothetical protein